MTWRKTFQEMVILTTVAMIMALMVNTLSPNGISLKTPPPATGVPDEVAGFPVVGFQEAMDMLESETWVFVDARSAQSYADGHLPGAVSLPVYNMEDYIFSFLDNHATDMTVVTYCSGIKCTDSHFVAEELAAAGYQDVRVFAEGIAKWREEGMPVETQ